MSSRLAASLLAIALLGVIVLASPQATADAPVPTHEVGDRAGFGATIDLGEVAAPIIAQLQAFDASDDNFTLNELNFEGTADVWVTMEVVEKTTDYYTIQTDDAEGLRADLVVNVTSTQFPQEGTWPGDMSQGFCLPGEIPVTTETATAEMSLEFLATSSDLSKWNIADFSLRESVTTSSLDYRATSSSRNVPNIQFNWTACETTVEYIDNDVTTTYDISSEIRVAYSPALDYFDFPIADNETWSAFSNSTLGGTIAGTIDVVGLTPEEEQDLFDALNQLLTASGLTVTGLDGFPIVLEDVTILLGTTPYLQDGVIHDVPIPVELTLHARETTMTLADGNFHTVYLIAESPAGGFYASPCSWVYSPDDGFIVGYVCEFAPGFSFFELPNVPPDDAEQGITDTKQTYALVAAAPNPIADLFLKPPFLGILLIAAVAILVTALLVRRRRKPSIAPPPGMPPPQAPPPESPPGPP